MKHKSFNRTLAALLSVMLIGGLLPTIVFAAEDYKITVAGIQVTSDNASDVLGNGTVSYDHESKTLTLNNANLNGGILILQENAVNISIQGNNIITSDQYGIAKTASPNDSATPGELFISGSGSLEVTAQTNGIEAYREIVIDNVDLIINTVQFSLATYNERELIIKNGSEITAISEEFPTMAGGGINISDSKIDATAKAPEVNVLYASSGNISISNSTVKATGTSEDVYPVIYAAGDIDVTNKSNVEASSSGGRGIYTESNMTVTDSIVTAASTEEGGIYIKGGTLSLTNSELSASSNPSYWAIETKHFNVTNSEVTAKGGLLLERGDGDDFSFSITPANGKLAELKVDRDNWDGSAAVHFKEDSESPYDTTVNFNAEDMQKINGYYYVYIGEHIHTGGTATCEQPAICEDCDRPYGNALGHNAVKTEAKDPTCTEDGNIEYWTCDTCGKYFSDESATEEIILADTVIKATGHDYKDGKCTVCGTLDSTFKPVITSGANGEWQKGTEDGLSFTSNAAFAHFLKVQVDGKDLDASSYDVKEGSTIVTLKASYLETLPVGTHTLAIVSETGTASTEFTIKAAAVVNDDTESPQTGDNSNMILWITLLILSGGALSGTLIFTKKRFAKR